ncbi:FAD-binding protein [Candidatus Peregrinibacteria bacterium]|nr:FAD-binding protein [Candidatus Peregrinibacteria bacterium]
MKMHDFIIIGGGACGLTAGLYASRGGLKPLLLEKEAPGGQLLLTDNIENYPGIEHINGFDLAQKMMNHAQKFGLEMKYEGVETLDLHDDHVALKTKNGEYKAKYVLASLGSNPRKLGVPGEDKYRGKGVSYCATCDGAFYKDKECIIVGGGSSALDEGIALAEHASKVTIVHRRDTFTGEKYLEDLAKKNEKIEFLMEHEVKEIRAGDDGKVDRVLLYDKKNDKEYEFATEGVFIFIGYIPNSSILEGQVKLEHGEVVVNATMQSSHPRLYAGGDIRQGSVKQVIASGGDGAMAAISILHKLRSEQ